MSQNILEHIGRIQEEVRRVSFDSPEGLMKSSSTPSVFEGYRTWPFEGDSRKMLIVAPFVSEACLRNCRRKPGIVSRFETRDTRADG